MRILQSSQHVLRCHIGSCRPFSTHDPALVLNCALTDRGGLLLDCILLTDGLDQMARHDRLGNCV